MTVQPQANQTTANVAEPKNNDKEINFRLQEQALKATYEKKLLEERQARLEAEKRAQEAISKRQSDDDDNDDEPYVDHKKLKREQAKFGQQIKQETQSEIQRAVQSALHEERRNTWVNQNQDFMDVIQNNAEKFYNKYPELAATILDMPEGFERQKLVYKNIKALGLDKPEEKAPSIQEKIDLNRRGPYYQPSGQGAPPFASMGNFSKQGQKDAYSKMQELKNRLQG